MTAEAITADQERHRQVNMTAEAITADQERHRRPNMTPEVLARVRLRTVHRGETFISVPQQWDLKHPCLKFVYFIFSSLLLFNRKQVWLLLFGKRSQGLSPQLLHGWQGSRRSKVSNVESSSRGNGEAIY